MYNVKTSFSFAHDGVYVVRYETGQQSLPENVAKVAIAEGWAEFLEYKALQSAPENKASTNNKRKGRR